MVVTGKEAKNGAFPCFPIFLYCWGLNMGPRPLQSDTPIADLEAGIGEERSLDNVEHSDSGGSCR